MKITFLKPIGFIKEEGHPLAELYLIAFMRKPVGFRTVEVTPQEGYSEPCEWKYGFYINLWLFQFSHTFKLKI